MTGLPYYKAYPRDFLESTAGMTFEEKGSYRLVLDLIYMQSGRLPDDSRYVAGLLGCSVRKWNALRESLIDRGKIHCENGIIQSQTTVNWAILTRKLEARQAIPHTLRQFIFSRDRSTCVYCGRSSGPLHLDHIIPWSRGGSNSERNLVVACAPCNLSKGAKTPDEWENNQ